MSRVYEKIDLKLPLLIIKEAKGMLACGYINPETCNKTGEACAIVSGVSNYEEMLSAEVKAVSDTAHSLGVEIGMNGERALELFS